jgi:surface protein
MNKVSFIMTIKINENNLRFIFPNRHGNKNAVIDFGDGTIIHILDDIPSHTYKNPGKYDISITGEFPAPVFSAHVGNELLIDIKQWGKVKGMTDWSFAFLGCLGLKKISAKDIPTLLNDCGCMFFQCYNFNSDLSHWDVSNVKNMRGMFGFCENFNSDLSKWDMSNVEDISVMFRDCYRFNSDLSNWNLEKIKIYSGFNYGCRLKINNMPKMLLLKQL